MIPMNTELVRASLEMQHSQIFQRSIFLVPQSGKWRTLYLTVLHVLAPPMVAEMTSTVAENGPDTTGSL